jgi:hypothetical protein
MFTHTMCNAGRFTQHDSNRVCSNASFSMRAVILILFRRDEQSQGFYAQENTKKPA